MCTVGAMGTPEYDDLIVTVAHDVKGGRETGHGMCKDRQRSLGEILATGGLAKRQRRSDFETTRGNYTAKPDHAKDMLTEEQAALSGHAVFDTDAGDGAVEAPPFELDDV